VEMKTTMDKIRRQKQALDAMGEFASKSRAFKESRKVTSTIKEQHEVQQQQQPQQQQQSIPVDETVAPAADLDTNAMITVTDASHDNEHALNGNVRGHVLNGI
jgi:hypothetical protein